jgi:hypothetical protein
MATDSQDAEQQPQPPPPPTRSPGTRSYNPDDIKLDDEIYIDLSRNLAIDRDGIGYAKVGIGQAPGLPSQNAGYYPLYSISQLKQAMEAHEAKRRSGEQFKDMRSRGLAALIASFQALYR